MGWGAFLIYEVEGTHVIDEVIEFLQKEKFYWYTVTPRGRTHLVFNIYEKQSPFIMAVRAQQRSILTFIAPEMENLRGLYEALSKILNENKNHAANLKPRQEAPLDLSFEEVIKKLRSEGYGIIAQINLSMKYV